MIKVSRYLLLVVLLISASGAAEARLAATCGGSILSVDKTKGKHKSKFKIADYQVGYGAQTTIAVSSDNKFVRIQYPKCSPNENKEIPAQFLPAEYPNIPAIGTITLSSPELRPVNDSVLAEWKEALTILPGSDPMQPEFLDGGRKLVFQNWEKICLYEPSAKEQKWCAIVDPYSEQRAGPSMHLLIYRLANDYLVVTDFNGAFLIDPETGKPRWHYKKYSNMDAVPDVAEAGSVLIFSPSQEWQ